MIATALLIVSFAAPSSAGGTAAVDVYTDSNPRHWREWTVIHTEPLERHERCQYRVDARRVLRHRAPTQHLPEQCIPRSWHDTPDPAPEARR